MRMADMLWLPDAYMCTRQSNFYAHEVIYGLSLLLMTYMSWHVMQGRGQQEGWPEGAVRGAGRLV